MTNAYQTAQNLGLVGTDQEIVDQLKAVPLHRRNVYITGGPSNTESINLLHLLTARHRVMGMGPAQQWVGPLIELESTNAGVAQIMSILRPMLQVNDTLVYCKDSDDAAGMLNSLTAIVGQLTGKSAQVVEEVALLSGGRIGADFTSLTVEQFAASRTEYEQQQALQDWKERFDAALNTFGTVEQAAGVAAIRAIADEIEAAQL